MIEAASYNGGDVLRKGQLVVKIKSVGIEQLWILHVSPVQLYFSIVVTVIILLSGVHVCQLARITAFDKTEHITCANITYTTLRTCLIT